MNFIKNFIKITHSKKFYLFIFPKLRFIKAQFGKDDKQYHCELDDKLIFTNWVYFIDLKFKKFNKLKFKKYPIERRKNNIKFPTAISNFLTLKLEIPISINTIPITVQNKTTEINTIKPTKVIQNPIDLSIHQNLTICQTYLNQQIQACQVLNQ